MQVFLITLFAVAVLLLTAVPGYFLIKKKIVSEECIPGLSKLLVYVSNPCLVVYTFSVTEFSIEKLRDIGIFALLCVVINAVMLGGAYLVLRKKYDEAIYRIMTVATAFANCAFFGIPIIEALFPGVSDGLIVYTTVYAQVMNIFGWTVGSAIMARDTKYISLKKVFVSPATLGLVVALAIFLLKIPLEFVIPGTETVFTLVSDMVTILGRMATPISMLIMGMRLATMEIKHIFGNIKIYITIGIKHIVMPLAAFALVYFLPVDLMMKRVLYIICASPAASIVLNYSEMVGAGQKEAASTVLLSTMLSIVTLPVMLMLLQFL